MDINIINRCISCQKEAKRNLWTLDFRCMLKKILEVKFKSLIQTILEYCCSELHQTLSSTTFGSVQPYFQKENFAQISVRKYLCDT